MIKRSLFALLSVFVFLAGPQLSFAQSCTTEPSELRAKAMEMEMEMGSNTAALARIKRLPRANDFIPSHSRPERRDFFPAALKGGGQLGAVSTVRSCVDDKSRLARPPVIVTSSMSCAADAAAVKLAAAATYIAGKVDGRSVPSCVSFRVFFFVGEDKRPTEESLSLAVARLNKALPLLDGDVEIKSVEGRDGAFRFIKSLWKLNDKMSDSQLRDLFNKLAEKERSYFCRTGFWKDALEKGATVMTEFQTAYGGTVFFILLSKHSCFEAIDKMMSE